MSDAIWGLELAGESVTQQQCAYCVQERVAKPVGALPHEVAWMLDYADSIAFTRTPDGDEHLELIRYSGAKRKRIREMARADD
jgi:hypothetical protein